VWFRAFALPLALLLAGPVEPDVTARTLVPMSGSWSWPVHGSVIRDYEPPETPYGVGHRGIDIAVAVGTTVRAPEGATVSFAGKVGGQLFVTLDHGGGLESTYSWLASTLVRKGDVVARGQAIATSGQGHPDSAVSHLHFGVKLDDAYVDPLDYLGPAGVEDLIRLAPLAGVEAGVEEGAA
jgi:murein DD-endopeptidase MepM/ murein hydrolase activator NlpD